MQDGQWLDASGDARLRAAVAGQTVPRFFRDTVARRGDQPAHRWLTGDEWTSWSWNDYADRACRTAAYLSAEGVGTGHTVALMMRNRPEFHPIDMGAYLAGAAPFSVYNSSSPEQIVYLLEHSGARVVLAEPVFAAQLHAALGSMASPPDLVMIDGGEGSWEQRIAAVTPVDLDAAAEVAAPDDLATLIYTSGTTGPPKAVMLTHANISWLLAALVEVMGMDLTGRRMLSYLPMAHVAERIFTHYLPAREGALVTPCPDPAQVGRYLPEVRPEAFFGPPRVFEKMRSGLLAALTATADGARATEEALAAGRRVFEARSLGIEAAPDVVDAWEHADRTLLAGIRTRIGLDACQVAFTGAAPPPVEVIEFFNFIGVPLSEVYGLSEDTGLMTAEVRRPRVGTVGRPIPGCSVRLLDDGEILCRGGHVFAGYMKDPDKTAEVLDDDGWLHTGDIGSIDAEGYIRIVDRKKELIITAGGKNISPANIEARLKQQPIIGEACVIGDRRPYVTAVLTLDADAARSVARDAGLDVSAVADLVTEPAVRDAVDQAVRAANEHLSNVERVKKFHLATDEWLPDSDLLTPTMKLKRRGVLARYADHIESLYAE
ncbi:MAG: long-chain fatty acid--CoA ligase [Ilumatobacteraceae bacterium]